MSGNQSRFIGYFREIAGQSPAFFFEFIKLFIDFLSGWWYSQITSLHFVKCILHGGPDMDAGMIVLVIFLVIVVLVAIFAFHVFARDDYYDEVSSKLAILAGTVFINDREGVLDFLHYSEVARRDRVSIANYKKQVAYMVTRAQEKRFICDGTATKILDIVYKKWKRDFGLSILLTKKLLIVKWMYKYTGGMYGF